MYFNIFPTRGKGALLKYFKNTNWKTEKQPGASSCFCNMLAFSSCYLYPTITYHGKTQNLNIKKLEKKWL
jgi:hypothetical protein